MTLTYTLLDQLYGEWDIQICRTMTDKFLARPETLSLMWVIVCLRYLKVVSAQEQVKELYMYKVVLNAELLI